MSDALERSGADSSIARNARHNAAIAWIRLPISVAASSFLFNFVDVTAGFVWLGAVAVIEAVAWHVRSRLVAGDMRFAIPHVIAIGTVCIAWVILAVVLWTSGGDVSRFACLVTLFSVAFYGVAGGYKSLIILVALAAPPLFAIFAILTSFAWSHLSFWPALLTTFATFGACATVAFVGHALHRSDRGLESANADLRLLTGQLKELAERERVASTAKDNFLANVSHEIRTPLNGIIGLAATLDTRALSSRDQQSIEVIRQSGEMLERLISDILDAAAVDAGGVQLRPGPFNPAVLAKAAVALMQPETSRKGLTMSLAVAPEANTLLVGDEVRIRQVILNLLYNAIKYTDVGGITFGVSCEPPAGQETSVRLVLTVRDTGRGFDPATHQKLFERFERGSQPGGESAKGLGLGLAITQALVRNMGGEINVASTPLVGSTFKITLPLPRATQADVAALPVDLTQGSGARFTERAHPLRILLVEDHPINQIVVSTMLEAIGAQTTTCQSGDEAVEAARDGGFDLILMDLLLPGMDGFAATRAIRSHEEETGRAPAAIIMLTASALPAQAEKAKAAGCNAHITKPVTPARLFEAIGSVLPETVSPA